jgi:hypothetical protein
LSLTPLDCAGLRLSDNATMMAKNANHQRNRPLVFEQLEPLHDHLVLPHSSGVMTTISRSGQKKARIALVASVALSVLQGLELLFSAGRSHGDFMRPGERCRSAKPHVMFAAPLLEEEQQQDEKQQREERSLLLPRCV